MNIVMIVPTGIGAEIGGHAGDANAAAKLIASTCDNLITHPNVVNASDINEMTENTMYVEGSILDRFLEGSIKLKKTKRNKILVAVNAPVQNEIINAVSAARVTIGIDAQIIELNTPIKMIATIKNKIAIGDIYGTDELLIQLQAYDFDVLIVNTPIDTDNEMVLDYLSKDGGINIWGGVEAKLSKLLSQRLNKPVIHAPIEHNEVFKQFKDVVDPRKAPEMVSVCYLHCCLKGAHNAPRISNIGFSFEDIDFLISPDGCVGRPHRACIANDIPIIVVKENKTCQNKHIPTAIYVENYLEAVGVVQAYKAGVSLESIRRPIQRTVIL